MISPDPSSRRSTSRACSTATSSAATATATGRAPRSSPTSADHFRSNAVSDSPALTVLDRVRLVPVVHLIPSTFGSPQRPIPFGLTPADEEWDRYWRDCLADVGIGNVTPLELGSGHVPVRNLLDPKTSDPALAAKILSHLIAERGDGGLALCRDDQVLVAPRCCVDLNNLGDWRYAAGYRESEWTILWVGHPYLM